MVASQENGRAAPALAVRVRRNLRPKSVRNALCLKQHRWEAIHIGRRCARRRRAGRAGKLLRRNARRWTGRYVPAAEKMPEERRDLRPPC